MLTDKFWIFGRIARFFAWLHYRYEVAPYCKRKGHGPVISRQTVEMSAGDLFAVAWRRT